MTEQEYLLVANRVRISAALTIMQEVVEPHNERIDALVDEVRRHLGRLLLHYERKTEEVLR